MEQDIIDKSRELFLLYGFKSVTMNDIARSLGMSKKTLYQWFDKKEDLISKVVAEFIEIEKEFVTIVVKKSKDAIEEMHDISLHVNQMLRKVNPSAIYDLQKYYRSTWNMIESYRSDFIFNCIKSNLNRGMEEGVYRKEIRPDIISRLYISMQVSISNPSTFPQDQFTQLDLYQASINYHIHGVLTRKGLDLLEKYEETKKDIS